MFYAENLLAHTAPLARVWLAANMERKLSKTQILQSDLPKSIAMILDQTQAPMALRLSGQLMLGVVRIYGKQAKYLLDDIGEMLMKIRLSLRATTNHDSTNHLASANELDLPDLLTVDDLFPQLDMAFSMTQTLNKDMDDKLQDFGIDWSSTLNPQQSAQSRLTPDDGPLLNDDPELELNFDDPIDLAGNDTSISINVGRNASSARPLDDNPFDNEKVLADDDLQLNFDEDEPMMDAPLPNLDIDDRVNGMGNDDGVAMAGDETMDLANLNLRPRDSQSLLSEADPEVIRNLDATFVNDQTEVEEVVTQAPQRSKKRKAIVADVETVLHNRQIKAQQEDRSKILKPVSFLPRDPYLLTLMNMQKNGDFVSNIMNDGRSRNWAPELQGLLSFDVVRQAGERKRKRDSGIADLVSEDEHSDKSPRLERSEEDDDEGFLRDEGVDMNAARDRSEIDMGAGDHNVAVMSDPAMPLDQDQYENEDGIYADGGDAFDETTMPLVHPADNGPVSLGTKHAVHMLRERFGGEQSDGSPSSQVKKTVLLQDLVPEKTTSREDATKMFFEVLVLATKDAIKVDQADKAIGMPLRIRGKRGLWGSWAETTTAEESAKADNMVGEGVAV